MKDAIRKSMLKHEKNLSEYASLDKDAIRFKKNNDDFRPNYFRDIDRIIHSLSYTRYIDKTQVYSSTNNDNVSKRIIHVQLVSKIARTIGRALILNEDLIEAIALSHDIGHVPFGHPGESILNEISNRYGEGNFMHNVQGVRTMMYVEKNGIGNNLTVQVLDGILCHNGEFVQDEYYPKEKTKDDFLNDYLCCYRDDMYGRKLIPMTLEGCVVRISDIIGYIGRDIEDAIRLGNIEKSQLPKKIVNVLGDNNRDIVNTIILDIIENSYGKPYIKMSKPIYESIKALKQFNYENIYYPANTKEELDNYKKMFNELFTYYLNALENHDNECSIYKVFLNDMCDEYLINTTNVRKVIDFIAGMTDDYFVNEYDINILNS